MPPLSSLHGIPPDFLATLSFNFPTIEAFLISEHANESKVSIQRVLECIASQCAPPMQNGLSLYLSLLDEKTAPRILPTGVSSLDSLLGGGLREGFVTELLGETTSGKTQICHQLAATTSLRGEHVVYFDTTNSFSPERFLSIARSNHMQEDENQEQGGIGFDAEGCLERILVFRPHSHVELMMQLETCASDLPHATKERALRPPSVLIIDSISAVLAPISGTRKHAQGDAIMLAVSGMVKDIIKRHQMACLWTCHVSYSSLAGSGDQKPFVRPALGDIWRNQASTRLTLSLLNREVGVRVAERTQSSNQASGPCAYFAIGEGGVVSVTLKPR
jgi:RAD51-like protein 3